MTQYRITHKDKSVIVDTNTSDKSLVLWRAMNWSEAACKALDIDTNGVLGFSNTDKPSTFLFHVNRNFYEYDYMMTVQRLRNVVDNAIKV